MLEAFNVEDGITINCGVIRGGTCANIISDECRIEIDIRFNNSEQRESALARLEQIASTAYVPGSSAYCRVFHVHPAMECTDDNFALFRLAADTERDLGLEELVPMVRGGCSDSAYTVEAGVPTVCSLGTIGKFEHAIREEADIRSLLNLA